MKDVVFVTGSAEKAANFSKHMGASIEHKAFDLEEIQTLDTEYLAEHKAKQAYSQILRPVLVEDVSFTFNAFGRLPGPFIKYYVDEPSGVINMCRMLDGFENKTAQAACVFCYYDGTNVQMFEGKLHGRVTKEPRGSGGFGFDRIFEPDGFEGKTAAELTSEEYDGYYSLIKPFDKVKAFLYA